ncbi:MAG: imidazole glycerol phosphate synthase subunit HisH [Acidimicrobiia bacterium]|nr:imidazole glycerol phosphate synthase subunit HisH [Acidimicrobiia bacterium]MDH5521748.1 imidazole glycerol phosphate synthase subunit HisH [Acidimicrobiia bacterium]
MTDDVFGDETSTGNGRPGETGSDRPTIAVLDYGIGNLRSAQKALQKVGADAHLTADPGLIKSAAGVVLPGVGAFGACMDALHASGLDEQARLAVASGRPFLGICVGMQMLFDGSEESPDVPGLGLLPGMIGWLPDTVKRPQMQWNRLTVTVEADTVSPFVARLLDGLDGSWMYFVHSLAAEPGDDTVATVDYGGPVVAAVGRDNMFATQFHPEKSARPGLALLGAFVDACRGAAGGGGGIGSPADASARV